MDVPVKQEVLESPASTTRRFAASSGLPGEQPVSVIDVSSSDSDSESENVAAGAKRARETSGASAASSEGKNVKKKLVNELAVVLPGGLLQTLPPAEPIQALPAPEADLGSTSSMSGAVRSCKQFWKAGDYEGSPGGDWNVSSGGMDHVRVHPKFLHSNATSHKWALGAFAELLDNALDEVCNGATFVNIDMIQNRKDGSRMLVVEDNGGGMDPDKMRHCMSLGYSAKSKIANTIGQYGNGFKTSTMRLGADVIVFSRYPGKDGKSSTQSIGLLSYTFLRSTGKEDIVVPMLDYKRRGPEWSKIVRSSLGDWNKNVETIIQWSPFSSEEELLRQFNLMRNQGTRIVIYNLWEDDQGMSELDFDADPHDIQLRGVNRDEKDIQMAQKFPNSKHFLTYRHSLRSYVSILYLRLPPGFRIILRGRDVEHHNIVNDMMQTEQVTYRPQYGAEGLTKDPNMSAVVTIGFVKDAKHHVDVQGFNVYHKNRLIKPFWRIWNAAGSDGRGVIGVLEANFVEPAHDKQGFERTTVLSRLEARLVQMQKFYWRTNCHKIGYAPRRNDRPLDGAADTESSHGYDPEESAQSGQKAAASSGKTGSVGGYRSVLASNKGGKLGNTSAKFKRKGKSLGTSSPVVEDISDEDRYPERESSGTAGKVSDPSKFGSSSRLLYRLEKENQELRERLKKNDGVVVRELEEKLQRERARCRELESEVQAAKQKMDEMNKEQESLIDIFSEERDRRDNEEECLRKKLKEASNTIQELLDKIRVLERKPNGKR